MAKKLTAESTERKGEFLDIARDIIYRHKNQMKYFSSDSTKTINEIARELELAFQKGCQYQPGDFLPKNTISLAGISERCMNQVLSLFNRKYHIVDLAPAYGFTDKQAVFAIDKNEKEYVCALSSLNPAIQRCLLASRKMVGDDGKETHILLLTSEGVAAIKASKYSYVFNNLFGDVVPYVGKELDDDSFWQVPENIFKQE